MADLLAPRSPRRGRYPGLAPGRRDHNFVISPQLSAGSRRGAAAEVLSMNLTRGVIIAKPRRRDSKSNKRVCLIYLIVNTGGGDNSSDHGNGPGRGGEHNITGDHGSVSYWWSVGKKECERNILPGIGTIFLH